MSPGSGHLRLPPLTQAASLLVTSQADDERVRRYELQGVLVTKNPRGVGLTHGGNTCVPADSRKMSSCNTTWRALRRCALCLLL